MYLSFRRDVSFPAQVSKVHTSDIWRYGPRREPGGYSTESSWARKKDPKTCPYSLNNIHCAYPLEDFLIPLGEDPSRPFPRASPSCGFHHGTYHKVRNLCGARQCQSRQDHCRYVLGLEEALGEIRFPLRSVDSLLHRSGGASRKDT